MALSLVQLTFYSASIMCPSVMNHSKVFWIEIKNTQSHIDLVGTIASLQTKFHLIKQYKT